MATTQSKPSELHTLNLGQILSDLNTLPPYHQLFNLGEASSRSETKDDGEDLLWGFETGDSPIGRRGYVDLSVTFLEGWRRVERLNGERVGEGEVGLVLPSERGLAGASGRKGDGGGGRLKRTDLLHLKVADLQTRVDAWGEALQLAVDNVGLAQTSTGEDQQDGREGDTRRLIPMDDAIPIDPISGQTHQLSEARPPRSQEEGRGGNESAPIGASNAAATTEDFEDDDPWNV